MSLHLLTCCRTLKTVYFFTALKIASCILKGRIWPAKQPPPSLQLPSCSRMSTALIPTTCSHTPGSFSTSPTIIAANTVTQSPTPGISTRKCSILCTQFPKCASLLHMSKLHRYAHDAHKLRPTQPRSIIAKKCVCASKHAHERTHTHL